MDLPPPRPLPASPRNPEGRVTSSDQPSTSDSSQPDNATTKSLMFGAGAALGLVWTMLNYFEVSDSKVASTPVATSCYDVTWEGDAPLTVDQAYEAIVGALPDSNDASDLSPGRRAWLANSALIAETFAELARQLPADYSEASATIGYRAAVCADMASMSSLLPALVSSQAPTILVTEGLSFQDESSIAKIVADAKRWQSDDVLRNVDRGYRYDELIHAEAQLDNQKRNATGGVVLMSAATLLPAVIAIRNAFKRRFSALNTASTKDATN